MRDLPVVPYAGTPDDRTVPVVLSIVGFVLSFFGFSLISIVMGFIGLSQIKKTGERGRGFALAAIIIGFASIVIGIIVAIVVTTTVMSNPDLVTY